MLNGPVENCILNFDRATMIEHVRRELQTWPVDRIGWLLGEIIYTFGEPENAAGEAENNVSEGHDLHRFEGVLCQT